MDQQPDIKALLERNIALSEEILKYAKKTHHHLMWDRVFGTIKLLIILAPLLAAAWYLPQYFSQATGFAVDFGKQFQNFQGQMQQLEQVQEQMPKRK